jgi:hypothetical protein
VLAFKEAVLAKCDARPNCERTVVPVDLRAHWANELIAAGFDSTAPTAWLAEGLLLYLTADEVTYLLTEVGELSAPNSQLSFEHGTIADTALLTQARAMPAMDQYTAQRAGGTDGLYLPEPVGRAGHGRRRHPVTGPLGGHGRPVAGLFTACCRGCGAEYAGPWRLVPRQRRTS